MSSTNGTAARVSLDEQIKEVEREIRQRARLYPKWVEAGRYKQDTAEAKLAAMRGAHESLMWLDANLHWIKPEAERRLQDRRLKSEADELRDHPAVGAVMDAFADAEITDVRTIKGAEPQREDA